MKSVKLLAATCLISLFLVTFLITIANAGSSFKFAIIADPLMSIAGPNSPANGSIMFKNSEELLESAIKSINQKKDIDFVLALG